MISFQRLIPRVVHWNTGLSRLYPKPYASTVRKQIPSSPFKKPSERANRAVKTFQKFQNPFRKFRFISRKSGLINGLTGERGKKINDGAVNRRCLFAPACSLFLLSLRFGFFGLMKQAKGWRHFTIADGVSDETLAPFPPDLAAASLKGGNRAGTRGPQYKPGDPAEKDRAIDPTSGRNTPLEKSPNRFRA